MNNHDVYQKYKEHKEYNMSRDEEGRYVSMYIEDYSFYGLECTALISFYFDDNHKLEEVTVNVFDCDDVAKIKAIFDKYFEIDYEEDGAYIGYNTKNSKIELWNVSDDSAQIIYDKLD